MAAKGKPDRSVKAEILRAREKGEKSIFGGGGDPYCKQSLPGAVRKKVAMRVSAKLPHKDRHGASVGRTMRQQVEENP
jgi:hypothetical protein